MARMVSACPILAARDIAAATTWYRDKLGFEIAMEMDGFAIVQRDRIELHFWKCDDRHIAENTSAYIHVDDADALRPKLQGAAEGGRISDVETREWGMREFSVWDPCGNLLRFGQPVSQEHAGPDSLKALIDAFAALPPEERQRSIAAANKAIREGRL